MKDESRDRISVPHLSSSIFDPDHHPSSFIPHPLLKGTPMPQMIVADAHFFLSKGRSKISLGYLRDLLELGADPFRDPELEGLEGKNSLVYVSKVTSTLIVPGRQFHWMAREVAKGLARLLLACPKPRILVGLEERPHFFLSRQAVRWEVRLANRRRYQFRLGEREFFVVARFQTNQRKKPIWIGVLGRKKERAVMSKRYPAALLAAFEN
jgi:hypothetical protein